MAYDLIPLVLLIGSMVGIAVIIGKKFPQIKALDVESIPAEQELRLKQRLLANRLRRHLRGLAKLLGALSQPLLRGLRWWLKRSYQRVLELESRYRRQRHDSSARGPAPTQREQLLEEAIRLRVSGNPVGAEEKLMLLIGIDARHVAAYELLGDIYLEMREFAKAREVFAYLIKLLRRTKLAGPETRDRIAATYLNLASACQELGHNAQALAYARKAAALAPSNPRLLDFLLKISIVVKDKALAEKAWQSLQAADPGNAKLAELRSQIDQLR